MSITPWISSFLVCFLFHFWPIWIHFYCWLVQAFCDRKSNHSLSRVLERVFRIKWSLCNILVPTHARSLSSPDIEHHKLKFLSKEFFFWKSSTQGQANYCNVCEIWLIIFKEDVKIFLHITTLQGKNLSCNIVIMRNVFCFESPELHREIEL